MFNLRLTLKVACLLTITNQFGEIHFFFISLFIEGNTIVFSSLRYENDLNIRKKLIK